jgi:hypothetical protein
MTRHRFKFNRSFYHWLLSRPNWVLMRSGAVVAEVVPDPKHPTMFRIEVPGMPPADMVNLTRAKDAALSLADAVLDGRIRSFQAPGIAGSAEATRQQPDKRNASRTRAGVDPTRRSEGIASHPAEPADDTREQVSRRLLGLGGEA